MQVHVKCGYEPVVQLTLEEINTRISSGIIDPDTSKGWHAGLDSWIPLSEIKGIKLATPPELPADETPVRVDIQEDEAPVKMTTAAPPSNVVVTRDRRTSRSARFFMVERPGTWRRFYAFLIDLSVARLALELIAAFIFLIIDWWPPYEERPVPWFIGTFVVIVLFFIFTTALNLSVFGTTLGKCVFGLRVRSDHGHKLRYSDAFVRQTYALGSGAWFLVGFPVLTLIALFRTYQKLQRDNITPWDSSCGSDVFCKRISWARYFIGTTVAVSLFVIYCAFQFVVREEIRETLRRFFL